MDRKTFVLDSQSLKLKEALNKDFLEIELYAIAEGGPYDKCIFLLDGMKKALPTFYNKFILGYFNTHGSVYNEGNFEEHNADLKFDKDTQEKYLSFTAPNAEKALGIIRESDTVEIVDYQGKKWIHLTAAILTKYNREAVKHLLTSKKQHKVSVEITVVKSYKKKGNDIIEEFILDGITILGTQRNSMQIAGEGVTGAHLEIKHFMATEDFQQQKKALTFAYKELEEEALPQNSNEKKEKIKMEEHIDNKNEDRNGGINLSTEKNTPEVIEENKAEFASVAENNVEQIVTESENLEQTSEAVVETTETFAEEEITSETETTTTEVQETFTGEEQVEETETTQEVVMSEDKTGEEKEDCTDSKKEECNKVTCSECEDCEKEEEEEHEDDNHEEHDEEKETEKHECNTFASEDKEEENVEGIVGENTKSFTEEVVENEAEVAPAIDFEMQFNELNKKFNDLTNAYNSLDEKYKQLFAEKEDIEKENHTMKCEQMKHYGLSIMKEDEEDISSETFAEIETKFCEQCKVGKFASCEQVKDFVEGEIAKAYYKMSKEQKNNKTKEFSSKLNSTTVTTVVATEDSLDKLRQLLKI